MSALKGLNTVSHPSLLATIALGVTGLLRQTHLEQRCPNAIIARQKHSSTSGNTIQEDSSKRLEASRNDTSSLEAGLSRPAIGFPLLSSPTRYTQLFGNPKGLSAMLFRRGIVTNHNFNTNKIVTKLEKNGFLRGQAEVVMRSIKALLGGQYVPLSFAFLLRTGDKYIHDAEGMITTANICLIVLNSTKMIRKNILTTGDLENESYLFKAALTELRTELQILRKNDAAALAIRTEIISREIDSLNQKLREDIANLKNDIAIDMNSRKSDVREEQKALEIQIQSMSNHYMAQLGDMRTKMEAAKWEATRKGMGKCCLAGMISATLLDVSIGGQ